MVGVIFRGRKDAAITSDWPDDAVIIGGQWNFQRMVMELVIESASFDEVPEGHVAPTWAPILTAHAVEPGARALMELIERMRNEALT